MIYIRIIIISVLLVSCKEFHFHQINSDKPVYITYNTKYQDSVKISVPIKFKVENMESYSFMTFNFIENNEKKAFLSDFIILNEDYKILYEYSIKPAKNGISSGEYYLVHESLNIPHKKAQEILDKYDRNIKLGEKFKDTVQLTDYYQFKKDFPEILEKLKRKEDYIEIMFRKEKDTEYQFKSFPIKW